MCNMCASRSGTSCSSAHHDDVLLLSFLSQHPVSFSRSTLLMKMVTFAESQSIPNQEQHHHLYDQPVKLHFIWSLILHSSCLLLQRDFLRPPLLVTLYLQVANVRPPHLLCRSLVPPTVHLKFTIAMLKTLRSPDSCFLVLQGLFGFSGSTDRLHQASARAWRCTFSSKSSSCVFCSCGNPRQRLACEPYRRKNALRTHKIMTFIRTFRLPTLYPTP